MKSALETGKKVGRYPYTFSTMLCGNQQSSGMSRVCRRNWGLGRKIAAVYTLDIS